MAIHRKTRIVSDDMTREEYFKELSEQYSVVKLLSKGNKGQVVQLRHKTLQRDMVLRSYSEPVCAYSLLKSVHHDNLPDVYDVPELDDGQIVLEEYVEGLTVSQVLESGLYTYRGAKKVLSGVCSALLTLHSMGIIHRDIKPENIIITSKGEVKLIDLNASRMHSDKKLSDTVPLGTVGYAPPEQYGISQSDVTADIYALGVLLNVMLTGKHPSAGLAKGRARGIILRCTGIAPEKRIQSVEKLMRIL